MWVYPGATLDRSERPVIPGAEIIGCPHPLEPSRRYRYYQHNQRDGVALVEQWVDSVRGSVGRQAARARCIR
jgi:hypothetical protein